MKWSIISESVTIIILVEFIDQLIDYPINCASLTSCLFNLSLWTVIANFRVVSLFLVSSLPLEITLFNSNSVGPGQTPRSEASDLVLHMFASVPFMAR